MVAAMTLGFGYVVSGLSTGILLLVGITSVYGLGLLRWSRDPSRCSWWAAGYAAAVVLAFVGLEFVQFLDGGSAPVRSRMAWCACNALVLAAGGLVLVRGWFVKAIGALWIVCCYGLTDGWFVAGAVNPVAVIHAVEGVVCVGCYVVMLPAVRAAVRDLESAKAGLTAAAVAKSAARARDHERFRVDALVHDSLLSHLMNAARLPPTSDGRYWQHIAEEAALVLRHLAVGEMPTKMTPDELTRSLYELVGSRATVTDSVQSSRQIPSDVADSVIAAVGEALRNSERHAAPDGRPVHRFVTIAIDDEGVVVTVADDGVGFDADAVCPSRLGLKSSIQRRMAMVGGEVVVTAGTGTSVVLHWNWP